CAIQPNACRCLKHCKKLKSCGRAHRMNDLVIVVRNQCVLAAYIRASIDVGGPSAERGAFYLFVENRSYWSHGPLDSCVGRALDRRDPRLRAMRARFAAWNAPNAGHVPGR